MQESPFKGKAGFRRIFDATAVSLAGLKVAVRSEHAFRMELALGAGLVVVAFLVSVTGVERALMIGCVFLILIVEILNSALEAAVDRISLERHPLAKRAKDLGSAAVFLALVNLAVVWLLILTG
jgi:diacylglycerol kinase (ATP)